MIARRTFTPPKTVATARLTMGRKKGSISTHTHNNLDPKQSRCWCFANIRSANPGQPEPTAAGHRQPQPSRASQSQLTRICICALINQSSLLGVALFEQWTPASHQKPNDQTHTSPEEDEDDPTTLPRSKRCESRDLHTIANVLVTCCACHAVTNHTTQKRISSQSVVAVHTTSQGQMVGSTLAERRNGE